MTFDKQVEKAKEEKLKQRITRDVVFIILGIIFLALSILVSYKNNKTESENKQKKENKTVITNVKSSGSLI